MTENARPPSVFDRAFLTDAEEVVELLLIRHGQQVIDPEGVVGDLLRRRLFRVGAPASPIDER